MFILERDTGVALYLQIARTLEHQYVKQGNPGDRLPPEGELAEYFGVNRHTLRRAVEELVNTGMLERQHGVGVFVADRLLDYQLGVGTRFTQTLADLGITSDSKVLKKQIVSASAGVARQLKLREEIKVLWIETLRFAGDAPLCLVSHFLPLEPFGELLLGYGGGSLHQVIIAHHGNLRRTESLITAVIPQSDDAKLLGIPQSRPVLRVKSLNVLESDGASVEYAITRFRADRVQLRVTP